MGRFEPGSVPQNITPGAFRTILDRIAHAVNFLDTRNFPNPLEGDSLIAPGSLSLNRLKGGLIRVHHEVFVALAVAYTTTSTAGVDVGGYFRWDPGEWPAGSWYLEASIAIANAAATATLTLKGAADVGSVSTQSTALVRVISGALTMPGTAQNLWVDLKTSSSSYAASLMKAGLKFVPS